LCLDPNKVEEEINSGKYRVGGYTASVLLEADAKSFAYYITNHDKYVQEVYDDYIGIAFDQIAKFPEKVGSYALWELYGKETWDIGVLFEGVYKSMCKDISQTFTSAPVYNFTTSLLTFNTILHEARLKLMSEKLQKTLPI
jgi:hypothetical protein